MNEASTAGEAEERLALTDALVALLLFAATFAYLATLPRSLGHSDESIYLYEAVRLLHGDRLYSDMFELITPGWMYLMAGVFWLFGPSIDAARLTAAALHGLSATILYLSCRMLGVRRALAWLPAAALLVVAQPAWQIASQHWLGTFLCIALLHSCLVVRRSDDAVSPFLPGLVVGMLIAVQQARGVFMAAGVGMWLIADRILCRRYRIAGSLPANLASFAAGALAVVVPVIVFMVSSAGFEPVWRALVVHPIFNYGGQGRPAWGAVPLLTGGDAMLTFPRLLAWLPAILVVNTVRLLHGSIRHSAAANTRDVLLITLLCSTAALSIFYFPDFIHIAFISPLFFVAISENAERLLRLPVAAARRAIDVVVPALAAILLVVTVVRLVDNQARLRERFANIRETRFGRVAFATAREAALHDALERRLAGASKRDIFTYPGFLNLYLTVGARNPTRFQFFLPGYNSPDQVASVLRDLERAKPPYVIVTSPQWLADDDPVLKYLRQHYALDSDSESDKLSLIYRRIAPPSAP